MMEGLGLTGLVPPKLTNKSQSLLSSKEELSEGTERGQKFYIGGTPSVWKEMSK